MTRPRVVLPALGALVAFLVPAAAGAQQPTVGPQDPPAGWPEPPALTGRAAILVDATSGQVLAAVEPDAVLPPASTVKILTALTALRRADVGEEVTVGEEVRGHSGATVGLEPGQTWTVGELVTGLLARSGNDAAAAIAVHVAGDVGRFVDLMRADAAELGLHGAVLASVDGLGDGDRLSPRHLATLGRALLADPWARRVASSGSVHLPGTGTVASRNPLLGTYPGATGLKTGQTLRAGRCIVASAVRDGRHLVAVVLGAAEPDGHARDAAALLDHGFDSFAPARTEGALEVRVAGAWIPYEPVSTVLVPTSGGEAVPARPPVVAGDDAAFAVLWADDVIAEVAAVPAGALPDRQGSAGAWLVDRAYEGMRVVAAGARP